MPTKNLQKTLKKPSAAPGNFEKPSKTFPRPPKTLKKPSPETFLRVLAPEMRNERGGARASARAPPLVAFKAKTHKNVSGEGFLRVLGGRGRVF